MSNGIAFGTGFSIGNYGYMINGQDANQTFKKSLWQYTPDAPSGVENVKTESLLTLSPNPCQDKLLINCDAAIQQVEVTDMLGRVVLCESIFTSKNFQLNTSNLPSGIFLVKTTDISGAQQTTKFVKE